MEQKKIIFSVKNKTPALIKKARLIAGETQQQAAETVHSNHYVTWNRWESGAREMPDPVWELYLIKKGLLKFE